MLHPGAARRIRSHAIWRRDFTGACSLFGVVFQPRYTEAEIFRMHRRRWSCSASARPGAAIESLAAADHRLHHPHRDQRAISAGRAVRLHIGLEESADLIADLEQGLEGLANE